MSIGGLSCFGTFPIAPHEPNNPMTNRCHRRAEREATWPFLVALVEMLRPKQLVAIGRDAGAALEGLDISVSNVRHPKLRRPSGVYPPAFRRSTVCPGNGAVDRPRLPFIEFA